MKQRTVLKCYIYQLNIFQNFRNEKNTVLEKSTIIWNMLEILWIIVQIERFSEGCIWRWTIIRTKRAVCKVTGIVFHCTNIHCIFKIFQIIVDFSKIVLFSFLIFFFNFKRINNKMTLSQWNFASNFIL